MSRILTASGIASEALGAIGKWPVTQSAPDGESFRRALTYLDLLLGELVGTNTVFSRHTSTLSFEITNGTSSYDLYEALGESLPDDGVQYVVQAWIEDGDDNRYPVEIVTRKKFEEVSSADETGRPCWVHIDRQETERGEDDGPLLRIFPTPHEDDETEWTLNLVAQRFSPNVSALGVSGTNTNAERYDAHNLGRSWQRYLIFQTAHDLGSGPVQKIGEASLTRFAAMAAQSKAALLAFANRERETTPPICQPWGL